MTESSLLPTCSKRNKSVMANHILSFYLPFIRPGLLLIMILEPHGKGRMQLVDIWDSLLFSLEEGLQQCASPDFGCDRWGDWTVALGKIGCPSRVTGI